MFTVDNLDYVRRDAYLTGVAAGSVDVERLRRYTFISDRGLTLYESGLGALEMFLTARRFMYQQVYFHRTVRAIDLDLAEVFGPSVRAIFGDGSPADRLAAYADLDEYALLHQAARWARGDRCRRTGRPAPASPDAWRAILLRRPTWRAEAEVRAEYEAGAFPDALDRDARRRGPGSRGRWISRSSTHGRPMPTATDRAARARGPGRLDAVARGRARLDPGVLAHRPALPAAQPPDDQGGVGLAGRRRLAPSSAWGRRSGSTSSGSTRAISATRQLHVLDDLGIDPERRGLERAEQAVVEVAAGGPAGHALVARGSRRP